MLVAKVDGWWLSESDCRSSRSHRFMKKFKILVCLHTNIFLYNFDSSTALKQNQVKLWQQLQ